MYLARGRRVPYFRAALVVAAAIVLSGCAGSQSTGSVGIAPAASESAVPVFQISSRGDGLPRSGQWRSQLVVADVNGDGYPDLIAPAARKGSGKPQIFLGQPDGVWSAWTQAVFPRYRLDYGGVAVLDFNADGRPDIVFGVHLKGLAAVVQSGPGQFHDSGTGLNSFPDGRPSITGSQSVLALPQRTVVGAQDLLVVYEAVRNSGVGASIWHFVDGKWQRRDVPGAPAGSHAAVAGKDRVFYLAGNGVIAVDVAGAGPSAQLAGRLPDGTFSHALATLHDVERGVTSAYVATSHFIKDAWIRRVERFSRLTPATTGDSASLPDGVVTERVGQIYFSALAAVDGRAWGLAGEILAVGDDRGVIEIYRIEGGRRAAKLGQLPAADWRAGCPVTYLEWAKIQSGEPPRLVAMFAGEASAYDLGRGCSGGGGLDVFAVAPSR